ncbi:MAG: hypothetical protein ACREQV_23090 [Candidatus Binatia bacterium]
MHFHIKLFQRPDQADYVIVITRGSIDMQGFLRIFDEVARAAESLPDSRILIDFEDADWELEPSDIDSVINRVGPEIRAHHNKIALVSGTAREQSVKLTMLSRFLSTCGFTVAVFHDPKDATSWLTEPV